jgi:hypothetical protein
VAALRTRLRHGTVPSCKITVGIVAASVEKLAATRTPLDDLSTASFFRAADADLFLLDVLALRIAAASPELAVAAVLEHELATALGTFLIERHIGFRSDGAVFAL